jgi:ribosomal protein L11 methyltransferase
VNDNLVMMANFVEIVFEDLPAEQKEMLIATLASIGYDGFEEEGDLLKAFIPEHRFDRSLLDEISRRMQVEFVHHAIADRNWNEEWEQNFHPVVIPSMTDERFVGIRAGFHAPFENVRHELVITPKMSFGTGHHATTAMVIGMMARMDFKRKTVLDFGTGTGVLAILAEHLGASDIIAIDIDNQSAESATENLKVNGCHHISVHHNSNPAGMGPFDIILANIIREVIIDNLEAFCNELRPGGSLVLSGLLRSDERAMLQAAEQHQFQAVDRMVQDEWICLQLSYNPISSDN